MHTLVYQIMLIEVFELPLDSQHQVNLGQYHQLPLFPIQSDLQKGAQQISAHVK